MKKIILLIPFILLGCSSSNMPSEVEVLTAYNDYGLHNYNIKVNQVSDLGCELMHYDFPDEKKMPNYKCKAKVSFTNGDTIDDSLYLTRRMNEELILESSYVTKVGALH